MDVLNVYNKGDYARVKRAMRQNEFIGRHVIALDHALLWVAALILAAFFHLSDDFDGAEALLLSTLVAYGAYLCESGLATLKTAVDSTGYWLDFRSAGLWGWIVVNVLCNAIWSLLFLWDRSWYFFVPVILTAGWQKYMDGRIPPRLLATRRKLDMKFN